MVAANTSGGVAGKMISPQSLSVATASSGLAGKEGILFRSAFFHSLAMALIISLVNLGLSFLF
jgi:lactate permease